MVPLQVDVGFGDALPVAPEEVTFPVLLGMAEPKLRAYSRETVVAENLEALVELGMLNSRFKDHFDLRYLAHNFSFERGAPWPRLSPGRLKGEIVRKIAEVEVVLEA